MTTGFVYRVADGYSKKYASVPSQREEDIAAYAMESGAGSLDPAEAVPLNQSLQDDIDYANVGTPTGTSEKEVWLMGNNWSIGGIAMNKANYDNFWRLYNGVVKNGGSKGEAFRYAANDFNSRRTMGQAVITLMAAAATAGVLSMAGAGSSLPAAQAAYTSSLPGGTALGSAGIGMKAALLGAKTIGASGQAVVTGGVLRSAAKVAAHSALFATAGQLAYGFISKFTNEWVPYYGKYEDWRKS